MTDHDLEAAFAATGLREGADYAAFAQGWRAALAQSAQAPISMALQVEQEIAFLEDWLQHAAQPVGQECCGRAGHECCGDAVPVYMTLDDLTADMNKRRGELLETLRQSAQAPAPAQPAPSGWYCAHCQRAVPPDEVTFHETHTECGRRITNDEPPAKAAQPAPSVEAVIAEARATVKKSMAARAERAEAAQPVAWHRIESGGVEALQPLFVLGDSHPPYPAKYRPLYAAPVAEAAQRVQQGWKMVPVEPTEDMLVLGQEAWAHTRAQCNAVEDCTEAKAVYEAMLAAAPDAPQAAQRVPQGWIGTDERMPDTEDPVLVYTPGGRYGKVWIDCWREQHEAPVSFSSATIPVGLDWDDHGFDEVSHWMPLPAPPATEPKGATHAQE